MTGTNRVLVSSEEQNEAKLRSKPLLILWRAEMEGRETDEALTKSTRVRSSFYGNLTYKVSDQFAANVEAYADLGSESSQTVFEDYRSKNGMYLREAALILSPSPWTTFKAGALSQEFLQAPLLLAYDRTFPSALAQMEYKDSNSWIQLVAQQAVPTSETLGTRTTDVEPTPSLSTVSLAGRQDISDVRLTARATYFSFSQLPSQIASRSQLFGNTVDVNTPTGDEFRYRFEGFEVGTDLLLPLNSKTGLRFTGSYLENSKAPSDINKGQLLSAQLQLDQIESLRLAPSVSYFVNQSDSSPGYYNSGALGHNNRSGYAFELKAKWTKLNIVSKFQYVNSRLINTQPFQPEQNYFLISVGTDYAEI